MTSIMPLKLITKAPNNTKNENHFAIIILTKAHIEWEKIALFDESLYPHSKNKARKNPNWENKLLITAYNPLHNKHHKGINRAWCQVCCVDCFIPFLLFAVCKMISVYWLQ